MPTAFESLESSRQFPTDFHLDSVSSCNIAILPAPFIPISESGMTLNLKRFSETHLSWEQYKALKDAIVDAGFLSMCTPWDEVSVDKIVEHEFDFMKIPSCYMSDWPLLERIAKYNLPIVASTAGEPLEEIDRVVSFFKHRDMPLAIMHCVGEYPAPDDHLHLGQIALLRMRYPEVQVGYSTHERPDNIEAVKIAIAMGAVMFEKHVGLPTEDYALNAYSATPSRCTNGCNPRVMRLP